VTETPGIGGTSGGAVYVDVLPNLKTFGKALRGQLSGAVKPEGKRTGDEFAGAFSEAVVPGIVRAVKRGVTEARQAAGRVHVDVEADTRTAARQIDALTRDRTIEIKVDADTAGATAQVDRLGNSSSVATLHATSLAVALASIGPVAIPALAATTGAVVGLGSTLGAVVAAVGVGATAFHGIGDAVKAYGDAQQATSSKVRSGTSALIQQLQAQQGAASRASALAGALRSVDDAEQRVAEASRRTRMAQLDLNDARREAARVLADLRDRTREGALSEKEANLALRQAQADLLRTQMDPRATDLDIESAQLRVERAQENLKQQQKDNLRLTKQRAEAERRGINGSEQVRDAQERIRDAMRAQADAQRQLADAQRNVRETGRANAISAKIQAAQAQKTAEAMGAQSAEARRLEQALDGLGPHGRRFARYLHEKWRPLLRTLKREAEDAFLPSVQTALTRVESLIPSLKRFVGSVGGAMSDVVRDATKAFSGRDFRRLFDYLEKSTPALIRTFGGIGISIARIIGNVMVAAGPSGQQLLANIAGVMQKIADWTGSPEGQERLRKFFESTIPVLEALARLGFQLLRTVAILMQSEGFKNFVDGLTAGVDALNTFMAANPGATEAALWGIFGALVAIKGLQMGNALANALAWLPGVGKGRGGKGKTSTGGAAGLAGVGMLPTLAPGESEKTKRRRTKLTAPGLKGISRQIGGGSKLGKIGKVVGKGGGPLGLVAGIGAGYVGSKIADGAGGGRDALGGALTYGATGAGIGALVGSIIPGIGTAIGAAIGGLAGAIFGAWRALGTNTIVGFFTAVYEKIVAGGKSLLGWLNKHVVQPFKPALANVRLAFDLMWAAVQVVLGLVQIQLKITGRVMMWLWRSVISPVLGWVAGRFAWAWEQIKPKLDALAGYIDKHVAPKFRSAVNGLGSIWQSLSDKASRPISFIIDTVLNNGLLKAYNWLAKKFGVKPDDVRVDNPFAKAARNNDRQTHREYASGGILPGYTPGRDVHRFYSPTGGTLNLSGGEGILRPEAVRALGTGTIHALNAAARKGRSFALGGILPDFDMPDLGSLVGKIGDLVTSPADGLRKLLEKLLGTMPGAGTDLGKVVAGAPRKLLAGVVGKLGGLFGGGDENAPGGGSPYTGRGGGNIATLVSFGRWLQSLGYTVSEHPAFGGVSMGAHVPGSAHYSGRAIDVNRGAGTSRAEQSWLAKIIGPAHAAGLRTIFMAPGHYNHAHIAAYDQGGWLQPGTSVVQNNTGRPEPVFTGRQFDQLVDSRARGSGDTIITVQRTEDRRIAERIAFEQRRRDLADRLAGAAV
jgi:hypothetical protein